MMSTGSTNEDHRPARLVGKHDHRAVTEDPVNCLPPPSKFGQVATSENRVRVSETFGGRPHAFDLLARATALCTSYAVSASS
jgi:hypothetical protein